MISLSQISEHERQTKQKESLAETHRLHRLVSLHAHEASQSQRRRDDLQRELTRLETANPLLSEDDPARTTTSRMFAFFVLAAYVIDFALASPVLHDATENQLMYPVLWVALPAMLVIAEVTVSICRFLALIERKSADLMTLAGVFFAMVMPGLVLSTQLASWIAEGESSSATNVMVCSRIASFTVLSLGIHLLLLFNGQRLYEAKIYLFVGRRRNSLQNRIRNLNNAYPDALLGTANAYLDYERARKAGDISVEPFDERTMEILNNVFRQHGGAGAQTANNGSNETAGGAGGPEPDASPNGEPNPTAGEEPEHDYRRYERELHI